MFRKLKNIIGIDEDLDQGYIEYSDEGEMDGANYPVYEEIQPEETVEPQAQEYPSRRVIKTKQGKNMSGSKVVGMPGLANSISEVVVIEPHSFEEMPQVIQALRERKSVVLNLNVMNPDEAQRAVDFVAGGTYAMDGHQERVGESIFLFTPSSVKVSTLTGIIHDVDAPPESRIRQMIQSAGDPWNEQVVAAQ